MEFDISGGGLNGERDLFKILPLATASIVIPKTGVMLSFSFTNLGNLDARSRPLLLRSKRSIRVKGKILSVTAAILCDTYVFIFQVILLFRQQ